jgi:hypothetical protein
VWRLVDGHGQAGVTACVGDGTTVPLALRERSKYLRTPGQLIVDSTHVTNEAIVGPGSAFVMRSARALARH